MDNGRLLFKARGIQEMQRLSEPFVLLSMEMDIEVIAKLRHSSAQDLWHSNVAKCITMSFVITGTQGLKYQRL